MFHQTYGENIQKSTNAVARSGRGGQLAPVSVGYQERGNDIMTL